ncbi:MAG: sigma-70 family RNA polymerase sigma factor [Spirochaetia bacterium]|nr:sigma-70 family RNA polymerase sigma factor [Spirochaetia bacterium]
MSEAAGAPHESTEEKVLVEAVQSGNEEAFAILVRRYQKRLQGILSSWVGRGQGIEDLVQETFVKVFRHIRSFRGESQFSTWIYRIAVNTARDHLKKEIRREKHRAAAEAALPEEGADLSERHTSRMDLERAMGRLPEDQRLSLLLVVRDGFSHREAAEIQACSVGTVSWRIHEARERLRKILKGDSL